MRDWIAEPEAVFALLSRPKVQVASETVTTDVLNRERSLCSKRAKENFPTNAEETPVRASQAANRLGANCPGGEFCPSNQRDGWLWSRAHGFGGGPAFRLRSVPGDLAEPLNLTGSSFQRRVIVRSFNPRIHAGIRSPSDVRAVVPESDDGILSVVVIAQDAQRGGVEVEESAGHWFHA